MEHLGTDFNITGSVMSRTELEALRTKRGECVTCGRKCFRKKLFKMIPIDEPGVVSNGRCLICRPTDTPNGSAPAARRATQADLRRFQQSQMKLAGTSTRSLMSGGSQGGSAAPQRTTRRAHSTIGSLDGGAAASPNPRPVLSARSHSYMPQSSGTMTESPNRTPPTASAQVENQSLPLPPPPSVRSMPPLTHSSSSYSHDRDRSNGNGSSAAAPTRLRASRSQSSRDSGFDDNRSNQLEELNKRYGSERSMASKSRTSSAYGEDLGNFHDDYQEALDRSVQSAASSLDGSHPMDSFDVLHVPERGALNRGGDRQVGNHFVGGSARTLSSMSSMEDDLPRMLSVYEERGEAVSEGGGSHPMVPGTEQDYMDSLQGGGENYSEIIIVLREAASSANIVRKGLEDLARCQLGQEDQEVLADMGAPEVVIDCISKHKGDLDVQLWGLGAVWNMSAITRNQLSFVRAGALDCIVSGMENYIDHQEMQEKSIAILSNLGAAKENLAALIDCGSVKRIVEAMNKHSEVANIQIKGCSAATNLASHNSPLKSQIMQLGIGGAVVVAMVMHPDDFFLQEKALRALRNLCANSDENKLELANIGGVDAVISAMQVHRDEAGVQLEGAWTLSNLAGNDSNKAVIGDCGGVDVVIRAMWVHSEDVGVQEWCCRALYTLTLDTQNGDIVLEVGGISAIVNAMQAHTDSAAVQEMGCAVLGNLAETKQNKMRIVDEEALDAIVLAMVLHADDMQIQERACMVLLRLAIAENYKPMQAANIGELVQTAGQNFPDRCQEAASRIVQAFGSDS